MLFGGSGNLLVDIPSLRRKWGLSPKGTVPIFLKQSHLSVGFATVFYLINKDLFFPVINTVEDAIIPASQPVSFVTG